MTTQLGSGSRLARRAFAMVLSLAAMVTMADVTGGCAPAEEEEETSTGSDSALSEASSEYEAVLAQISQAYEGCKGAGTCSDGDVQTASLHPLGGAGSSATPAKRLVDIKLCDALSPLRHLEHPYFFAGGSAKVAAGVTLADRGTDLVFDLRDQQVAIFLYHTKGIASLVGVEARTYAGYGFGQKRDVLDAWSGEFKSASASVETPFLKVAVGGSIFKGAGIWGGLLQAGVGLNAIPELPIGVGVDWTGHWVPWDAATRAFGKARFGVRYTERSAVEHEQEHVYLQLDGTKDIGLALVQSFGTLGFVPAAQSAALAQLKKNNWTVDRACPVKK